MATFYVTSGNDDGRETLSNGAVSLTETSSRIDSAFTVAFRFNNITFPQGTVLTQALFKLPQLNGYTGFGNLSGVAIGAEASDNAAALSTATSNLSSRSLTSYNYTGMDAGSSWESGQSLLGSINEVLARAGWVSGNSIVILFKGNGTTGSSFFIEPYMYDFFSGVYPAQLILSTTITQPRTQTGKAAIKKTTTRDQTGKAKVVFTPSRTQTGKSNIKADTQRNQNGIGNIRNDVTRNLVGITAIRLTAPKDQTGLSRIQKTATKTQTGKGRILVPVTKNQNGKGRIANAVQRGQNGTARIAEKPLFPGKRYEYKIYSPQGNYIGTLNNVLDDFQYSQEINSAGSEFTLFLGYPPDNFGENELIKFNNNVKVFVYDQDTPSGLKLFDGFISAYTPLFTSEGEKVQITVLGYGETLDNHLIEVGDTLAINQNVQDSLLPFGLDGAFNGYWLQHTITSPSGTPKLKRLKYKLKGNVLTSGPPDKADMIGQTVTAYVFANQTDLRNGTVGNALGSASVVIGSTTLAEYSFVFGSPITLTPSTSYYIGLKVSTNTNGEYSTSIGLTTTNPSNGGALYRKEGPTSSDFTAKDDPWYQLYTSGGNTTAPFLSEDPSDILRAIIDDYNAKGGVITYDNDSIDDTGTTVSYTFNTNTTLEGVRKCLELAPQGWYFYIDQATNKLHFHQKIDAPDYLFLLDKHISTLTVRKSVENVVNAVYFTGGVETEGDPPLFRKYYRQASIDAYGLRIQRITDQRVTVNATADTMANAVLDNHTTPELSTIVEIIDNAIDNSKGYDLESIVLGKMLALGGPGLAGEGNSFWDKMEWDVDYWDYNLAILSTLVLQITKLSYTGDKVTLDLSTVPPDVNKRIEDINRNLEATVTVNNPEVAE